MYICVAIGQDDDLSPNRYQNQIWQVEAYKHQ